MQTMNDETNTLGSSMYDEYDRMLASIERRLPAIPAAGVRLQRSFNGLLWDVRTDTVTALRGSAGTVVDSASAASDVVADTAADEIERLVDEAENATDDAAVSMATGAEVLVPDLEEMTKAELYDVAQDRDLEGRSTMNKAELIAALRSVD